MEIKTGPREKYTLGQDTSSNSKPSSISQDTAQKVVHWSKQTMHTSHLHSCIFLGQGGRGDLALSLKKNHAGTLVHTSSLRWAAYLPIVRKLQEFQAKTFINKSLHA